MLAMHLIPTKTRWSIYSIMLKYDIEPIITDLNMALVAVNIDGDGNLRMPSAPGCHAT